MPKDKSEKKDKKRKEIEPTEDRVPDVEMVDADGLKVFEPYISHPCP
jgi:hypothetical protein